MGAPYIPPVQFVEPTQQQVQEQEQEQEQKQINTVGQFTQDTKSDADSLSDSKADSTSLNSSTQSNVQINQNSNRIEYGEIRIPETTLNLAVFGDSQNFNAAVTLSIPLGGGARRSVKKGLEAKIDTDLISNERAFIQDCISLYKEGYEVLEGSDNKYAKKLSTCKNHIIARNIPTPPPTNQPTVEPPVKEDQPLKVDYEKEIENLKLQNIELQRRMEILMNTLDKQPVPGKY